MDYGLQWISVLEFYNLIGLKPKLKGLGFAIEHATRAGRFRAYKVKGFRLLFFVLVYHQRIHGYQGFSV